MQYKKVEEKGDHNWMANEWAAAEAHV